MLDGTQMRGWRRRQSVKRDLVNVERSSHGLVAGSVEQGRDDADVLTLRFTERLDGVERVVVITGWIDSVEEGR